MGLLLLNDGEERRSEVGLLLLSHGEGRRSEVGYLPSEVGEEKRSEVGYLLFKDYYQRGVKHGSTRAITALQRGVCVTVVSGMRNVCGRLPR